MKKQIFDTLLTAFFIGYAALAQAALTAAFEPDTALVGEGVRLVFTSDKPFKERPNLALLSADLRVAGEEQRQASHWVNGVGRTTYDLIYTVFPTKEGVIQTPALTLNGETVAPAVLTVSGAASLENQAVGAQGGKMTSAVGMRLSGTLSDSTPYIGESVLYRVQLRDEVGLLDGEIRPPAVSGAEVAVIGEDKVYQKQENGKTITFFERAFLITPTQAGVLQLSPATFFGVVPDRGGAKASSRRPELFDMWAPFDMFSAQKEVYLETQAESLDVQEKPTDWQGWWLPTTQAVLSETWDMPTEIRVGEAIERTLTLSAENVAAERLPVPVQPALATLKVYPSPEKRTTETGGAGMIGTLQMTVALLPTTPGTLQIPAVSVPWFNTVSKRLERAVLPAKTLEVLPAEAFPATGNASLKTPYVGGENTSQNPTAARNEAPKTEASQSPRAVLKTLEHAGDKVVDEAAEVIETPMVQVIERVSVPMALMFVFGGAFGGALLALGVMLILQKRLRKKADGRALSPKGRPKKKKALPELYPFQ